MEPRRAKVAARQKIQGTPRKSISELKAEAKQRSSLRNLPILAGSPHNSPVGSLHNSPLGSPRNSRPPSPVMAVVAAVAKDLSDLRIRPFNGTSDVKEFFSKV